MNGCEGKANELESCRNYLLTVTNVDLIISLPISSSLFCDFVSLFSLLCCCCCVVSLACFAACWLSRLKGGGAAVSRGLDWGLKGLMVMETDKG